MLIALLISSAASVILGILLHLSLRTIRQLTHLHFRELVTTRHQYTKIIDEQRSEIRAITESYLRSEGKVYIPPTDITQTAPLEARQPSAFRFKPNPPKVVIKANG